MKVPTLTARPYEKGGYIWTTTPVPGATYTAILPFEDDYIKFKSGKMTDKEKCSVHGLIYYKAVNPYNNWWWNPPKIF